MEFARACGTLLFGGYKGSARKDERVLETGRTVRMYLTLNCTLKNGKDKPVTQSKGRKTNIVYQHKYGI